VGLKTVEEFTLRGRPVCVIQVAFRRTGRDAGNGTFAILKARTYADAVFHLIFMNKEPERVSGIVLVEQSEDIFRAFSETAKGTGGIVDSSQNPVAGFKHAMAMSEAYYILYYVPEGGPGDTRFKTIAVRLKNRSYSLLHRKGYFVN